MVTVGGQTSGSGIAKGSGYGVGLNRSSFHSNRFKPKHVEQHQVRIFARISELCNVQTLPKPSLIFCSVLGKTYLGDKTRF